MAKLRNDGGWFKNAAGVYVQSEPIGTSIMSGATTGDVLAVASDDTVEAKTLTAGTDITVTHGAGTITIASTASGGGGGGATVLYDSTALAAPASVIDTGAAGIAGGYDVLEIYALLRTDEAVASSAVQVTVNADTANNYDYQRVTGANATASANTVLAAANWLLTCPGANQAAGVFGFMRWSIPFYDATTAQKVAEVAFGRADTTAANGQVQLYAVNWRSTTAITRMAFTAPATKNFVAGSRVIIYGR